MSEQDGKIITNHIRALRMPRPGIVRVTVSPTVCNATCWCGEPAPRGIAIWTSGELFHICKDCFRKGTIKVGRQKRVSVNLRELREYDKFRLRPGGKYKLFILRFCASWRIRSERADAKRWTKTRGTLYVTTFGRKAKAIEAEGFDRVKLWKACAIQMKKHYDKTGWPIDKIGGWTWKNRYWSPLLNDGYGGYQDAPDTLTINTFRNKAEEPKKYWNPETRKFQPEPWLDYEPEVSDIEGDEPEEKHFYWWNTPDEGNQLLNKEPMKHGEESESIAEGNPQ